MPYIKTRRDFLEVHPREAENCGELNFAITSLLTSYVHSKGPSYQTYNEVIGVLECAKLELYRRVVGKYEDQKIAQNGDVYPDWMLGKTGRGAMQDAPYGVSPLAAAIRADAQLTASRNAPPSPPVIAPGAGTGVVHALREVLQEGFKHELPAEAELRHPHEFTDAEMCDLNGVLCRNG